MKIALLNENSQAAKNEIIFNSLSKEAAKKGHTVVNYGMYTNEQDHQLTYVQIGLLSSILLTTKAVDFVVTGCGTGQGVMLASNSFPNVLCGHICNPLDAWLFGQVNNGNAIAMPFAQGFGWGGEINLDFTFEKLFQDEHGAGYPAERAVPIQRNKKILDSVKLVTHKPLIDILKEIDQAFLKSAIDYPEFKEYFFEASQVAEITEYLRSIL